MFIVTEYAALNSLSYFMVYASVRENIPRFSECFITHTDVQTI